MVKRSWRRRLALVSTLAFFLPLAVTGQALADPTNNSPAKLAKAVTLNGVLRHLDAFQAIANANGDRAAGRPGYQASVNYVVGQLNAAGYTPTVQAFDFTYTDFVPRPESDVTGTVQGVDLVLPPTPAPSGCEAADFAGFVPGKIALIRPGPDSTGVGADRGRVREVLRRPGSAVRGRGVLRAFGLRAVHRRQHPGGWPVHRCGGVKTAEQAARYGGTAGLAFDPCYHQPCDTRSNLNLFALDTNADAIAVAVITFAFDTSTVNGVRAPGKSHGRTPPRGVAS